MPSSHAIGFVYLFEAKKIHLLKLGFSADVPKRLESIARYAPSDVSLVGQFRTEFISESCVHAFFDDLRFHGEWFIDHRSIRKLVLDIEKSRSITSVPIPFLFFRMLIEDKRMVAKLDVSHGSLRGQPTGTPQEWAFTTRLLDRYKMQIRTWRQR